MQLHIGYYQRPAYFYFLVKIGNTGSVLFFLLHEVVAQIILYLKLIQYMLVAECRRFVVCMLHTISKLTTTGKLKFLIVSSAIVSQLTPKSIATARIRN